LRFRISSPHSPLPFPSVPIFFISSSYRFAPLDEVSFPYPCGRTAFFFSASFSRTPLGRISDDSLFDPYGPYTSSQLWLVFCALIVPVSHSSSARGDPTSRRLPVRCRQIQRRILLFKSELVKTGPFCGSFGRVPMQEKDCFFLPVPTGSLSCAYNTKDCEFLDP